MTLLCLLLFIALLGSDKLISTWEIMTLAAIAVLAIALIAFIVYTMGLHDVFWFLAFVAVIVWLL